MERRHESRDAAEQCLLWRDFKFIRGLKRWRKVVGPLIIDAEIVLWGIRAIVILRHRVRRVASRA